MSKLALQSALPRRSLYVPADAKPAGFTRAVSAAEPVASGTASLVPTAPVQPVTLADLADLYDVAARTARRWATGSEKLPSWVPLTLAVANVIGLDRMRELKAAGADGPAE